MRKYILRLLVFLFIGYANMNGLQYMTDRDRKELFDLRNIQPPLGAIELKLLRSFPSEEDEAAGSYFASAGCMEMDANGNVYVSDLKADVIYKYDSTGKSMARFGRPGQGPGDISLPMKIKVKDDEIVVYEAGNMRLQYIDSKGKFKKSIRLFKSYMDLDILKDGQVIGALLSVEPQQSDVLLEVLSPEGMHIRSFGAPLDFKYDRSILNSRTIFVDSQNEVWLLFTYLALIQRYSMQGRLLQESKLETEFSRAKERVNRRMNSYRPNERVGYSSTFKQGAILDDHLYVVDYVRPRMWIWEVDKKLQIAKKYWANVGDSLFVRDIYTIKKNDDISFYLLGDLGDNVTKIHVFVIK